MASSINPETCQSELVVYKLVDHYYKKKGLKQFASFMYMKKKFVYTLGETATEPEFPFDLASKLDYGRAKQGLYAYSSFHAAKRQLDTCRNFGWNRTTMIKCVIPVGARFYRNRRFRPEDGYEEEKADLVCADTLKVVAYYRKGEWVENNPGEQS